MKRGICIVCCLFFLSVVHACNTCGCAGYNSFMGISNYRFTNYIGLSWNYYSFRENSDDNTLHINNYNTLELKGAYALGKRWQLIVNVPYITNTYTVVPEDELLQSKNNFNGPGDINAGANYLLYSNADSVMKNTKHFLSVSGGIELPTGKFNDNFRTEKTPPAIATGSGSTDVFAGLQYTIATMKWNFRTTCQYKLNTQNTTGYNFGDQQSAEIYAARKFAIKKNMVVPFGGIVYEHLSPDHYYTVEMEGTGADLISLNTGLEINIKKINIGSYIAMPLKNTIGEEEIFRDIKMQVYASLTL